jgi:trans-aconitate methyltransferase
MYQMEPGEIQAGYDVVADAYAEQFFDELSRKPFDRLLLDAFAADCEGRGTVLDVGCGPGHVARYLSERGAKASGFGLSPAMVELARKLNPGLEFRAGDMRVVSLVESAGFWVDEAKQRVPYEFENPTPRLYVLAHVAD